MYTFIKKNLKFQLPLAILPLRDSFPSNEGEQGEIFKDV